APKASVPFYGFLRRRIVHIIGLLVLQRNISRANKNGLKPIKGIRPLLLKSKPRHQNKLQTEH
ncbi:MAG: hypothetical protein ACFNKE_10630, partial [Neisseria elongata]